jgi:hypothetical protein
MDRPCLHGYTKALAGRGAPMDGLSTLTAAKFTGGRQGSFVVRSISSSAGKWEQFERQRRAANYGPSQGGPGCDV